MDSRKDVSEDELRSEAKWIHESMIETLSRRPEPKESLIEKIHECLKLFRTKNMDIPYITVYHEHEL